MWSRGSLRKGHRGTPGLKKNMISFPPHIADLKILTHFFSRLGEHDVVDVRVRAGDAEDDEGLAIALRRGHCARLLKASRRFFRAFLEALEGVLQAFWRVLEVYSRPRPRQDDTKMGQERAKSKVPGKLQSGLTPPRMHLGGS